MTQPSTFINCEKCKKRLIEQKPDGMWYYSFGKSVGETYAPVEIYIYGSIKIKCSRKSCHHWNELTKFPEG
jgi:hypothetical protein